jgi:redox-sensitive bicupin YhaK (pirin superfamily)
LDPGRDKRLSPQVRLIATPKHVECEANQRLRKKPIAAIRWPGETGKMLFHPTPEQPTAPNAGILRLEPGAHHPEHYHGFAQVWFILKGEFTIDGRLCPPGTMLYQPDPHFEGVFDTKTGGEILIVQYPGPSTGERPIYAGRFNMDKRKALAEERVDL